MCACWGMIHVMESGHLGWVGTWVAGVGRGDVLKPWGHRERLSKLAAFTGIEQSPAEFIEAVSRVFLFGPGKLC